MIDCDFDKHRVAFGEGTGEHNFVEWMHTLTVVVSDSESGEPLQGATVQIESQGEEQQQTSLTTSGGGTASAEVLETIVRKNGFHDATPYRVTISREGFETQIRSGVDVTDRITLNVPLNKTP